MSKSTDEQRTLDAGTAWADVALAWADDEILIAHHLSELLAGWSEVEDLIALGSLAQDDLAHATLLYSLLEPDPRERDRLFFERSPKAFRNARLVALASEDWNVVIARQYLYELADRLRVEALLELDPPKPLADIAVGVGPEEAAHRLHWERWCETLALGDAGSERLERGIAAAWSASGDVLALPATCVDLPWPRADLERRWADEARSYLDGLSVAVPAEPPTPIRRPRGGSQPKALLQTIERSRRVYDSDRNAVWG